MEIRLKKEASSDSDDVAQLYKGRNTELALSPFDNPNCRREAHTPQRKELPYDAESSEQCVQRMSAIQPYIEWSNTFNNYFLLLGQQKSASMSNSQRAHWEMLELVLTNSPDVLKPIGIKVENDQVALIIENQKTKRCTVCWMRYARQNRCLNGQCLLDRRYIGYRFLKINDEYYCMLCASTFIDLEDIASHYLSHSINDIMFLGLNPFTLREALDTTHIITTKELQMSIDLNDRVAGLFSAHDRHPRRRRSRYVVQEEESKGPSKQVLVRGCLNFGDLALSAQARPVDEDVDTSHWLTKTNCLGSNELQMLQQSCLQHQLLAAVLPQRHCLCPHFHNLKDFGVGTYKQHVVIFYAREVLDKFPGGISAVFYGVRRINELVGLEKLPKGQRVVDIFYSAYGLELVLHQTAAKDQPELASWRVFDPARPLDDGFTVGRQRFLSYASRFGHVLLKNCHGVVNFNHPGFWVATDDWNADFIFVGYHAVVKLDAYYTRFLVNFSDGNFANQGSEIARSTQHFMRQILLTPVLYATLANARQPKGLTDYTLNQTFDVNVKEMVSVVRYYTTKDIIPEANTAIDALCFINRPPLPEGDVQNAINSMQLVIERGIVAKGVSNPRIIACASP